jgi:hypothetical protein
VFLLKELKGLIQACRTAITQTDGLLLVGLRCRHHKLNTCNSNDDNIPISEDHPRPDLINEDHHLKDRLGSEALPGSTRVDHRPRHNMILIGHSLSCPRRDLKCTSHRPAHISKHQCSRLDKPPMHRPTQRERLRKGVSFPKGTKTGQCR